MPDDVNDDDLTHVFAETAIRWVCHACGKENFDRAKVVEFDDPEEEDAARDALGIGLDSEGEILETPTTVTCMAEGCFRR